MARSLRIDELEAIKVAGINWRPVRRTLGITGFGINAYSADAGEQLIEDHDETGGGAGRHEELYLVLTGRATFTVDGETIDAPTGTLVFVKETTERRAAVAVVDGTTALVIGGDSDTVKPSAWEHTFAAQPAADAGDPRQAYEITAAGLKDHPDNGSLHYNLACYASLDGDPDLALMHLSRAFELDPNTRDWASSDTDLDAIRSDPRYPAAPAR